MRTIGLATVLTTTLLGTPAHSEKLYSYFEQRDNPPGTSVTLSPCTGSEVDECISHVLSCEKNLGEQPRFTMIGENIVEIASSIITEWENNSRVKLELINKNIDITIKYIEVYPNEMDGGWVITLGVGTADDFFYALNDKNSEGASLVVAGKRFPLAPQKGDGKKLVAWKNACMALEGQSMPVPASSTPDTKLGCNFNSRLYRASINKAPDPTSYQELQFTDGAAMGTVALTEYRQGQAAWTAHGSFGCSNGTSICRIKFPRMLGESVELPYEIANSADGIPEMVVIPALRQDVYQTERNAVMQGKTYGGLVVEFQGGFKPKVDELILPDNVYRYAGCR